MYSYSVCSFDAYPRAILGLLEDHQALLASGPRRDCLVVHLHRCVHFGGHARTIRRVNLFEQQFHLQQCKATQPTELDPCFPTCTEGHLLLADAATSASSECEEQLVPLGSTFELHPSLGPELVWQREHASVEPVQRVRLAVHDRTPRDPHPVYDLPARRRDARETHRDRAEDAQALLHHRVEVRQVVERRRGVLHELCTEALLNAVGRGEGELVHEEAQAVPGGVDPRGEVVHAFGCCGFEVAVVGLACAEFVQHGVWSDRGVARGVEDVTRGEAVGAPFPDAAHLAQETCEVREVVSKILLCGLR